MFFYTNKDRDFLLFQMDACLTNNHIKLKIVLMDASYVLRLLLVNGVKQDFNNKAKNVSPFGIPTVAKD
jgi:hypothetical protein